MPSKNGTHPFFMPTLAFLLTLGSARMALAAALPIYLGSLTSANLCSPRGVALSSSGDVFVGSDCGPGQHIEHFNAAGVLVGTWGFPDGFFGSPNGVTMDGSGNLYVTD